MPLFSETRFTKSLDELRINLDERKNAEKLPERRAFKWIWAVLADMLPQGEPIHGNLCSRGHQRARIGPDPYAPIVAATVPGRPKSMTREASAAPTGRVPAGLSLEAKAIMSALSDPPADVRREVASYRARVDDYLGVIRDCYQCADTYQGNLDALATVATSPFMAPLRVKALEALGDRGRGLTRGGRGWSVAIQGIAKVALQGDPSEPVTRFARAQLPRVDLGWADVPEIRELNPDLVEMLKPGSASAVVHTSATGAPPVKTQELEMWLYNIRHALRAETETQALTPQQRRTHGVYTIEAYSTKKIEHGYEFQERDQLINVHDFVLALDIESKADRAEAALTALASSQIPGRQAAKLGLKFSIGDLLFVLVSVAGTGTASISDLALRLDRRLRVFQTIGSDEGPGGHSGILDALIVTSELCIGNSDLAAPRDTALRMLQELQVSVRVKNQLFPLGFHGDIGELLFGRALKGPLLDEPIGESLRRLYEGPRDAAITEVKHRISWGKRVPDWDHFYFRGGENSLKSLQIVLGTLTDAPSVGTWLQVERRSKLGRPAGSRFFRFFSKPNVAELEGERDLMGLVKAMGYDKRDRRRGGLSLEATTIRKEAFDALCRLVTPNDVVVVEPLIRLWQDRRERREKHTAARLLAEIRDPRGIDALIAEIQAEGEHEQLAASWLGRIEDTRAVEPIIERLRVAMNRRTRHDGSRGAFAAALGKLGDARAIEILRQCLTSDTVIKDAAELQDFREEAKRALIRLGALDDDALLRQPDNRS